MKKLFPYILVLLSAYLTSCNKGEGDGFEIIGKIKGLPKDQLIVLEELGLDELKIIDSFRTKDDDFKLSGTRDNEQKLYRVRFGNRSIFLINDVNKIKVTANWQNIEDEYQIKGSAGSQSLRSLLLGLNSFDKKTVELHIALDSLLMNPESNDSLISVAKSAVEQTNTACLQFLKSYADTTKYLPVTILSMVFTQNVDNGSTLKDASYMNKLLASIDKRFGNTTLSAKFKETVKGNFEKEGVQKGKIAVGSAAPVFSLKDINGKPVSLSSFKGKYVLVDFWASWCPPCRRENPNMVATYAQFKDKNFTILGVSLDTAKQAWQQAIDKDMLDWTHVSDLAGWKSSVVEQYGIQSIPFTLLLDPEGKVVAAGLKGTELREKLSEVLAD